MIEVLHDHQPWPIGFPEEIAVPGRRLVAHDRYGVEVGRWRLDPANDQRRAIGVLSGAVFWEIEKSATTLRQWWLWHQIVAECMKRSWTLASVPLEATE